jgi:hypothetical protein
MLRQTTVIDLLEQLELKFGFEDFYFVSNGKWNAEFDVMSLRTIENKMRLENFSKTLISKVKMISIEMLQNITKHQTVLDDAFPYFAVGKRDNNIILMSGNAISLSDKEIIEEKLKNYLAIDPSNLREYYKQTLINNDINLQGNVGLGLLDIIFRTDRNVEYSFEPINPDLFDFNITVSIPIS